MCMTDVDLRLLRYFVAVVEEGSITRAASRLAITQPALSRAIRSLERAIGFDLLVRNPRRIEPTPAGLALLDSARGLDDQVLAAVETARAAGRSVPRLRVGVRGCDVLVAADLVASFQVRSPERDIRIDVVPDDISSQVASLRNGHCDVALLRDAFDTTGLDLLPLRTERRVVLLSSNHPLATRSRLRLDELHDDPITRWASMTATEAQFWAGADSDGHEWRDGPDVTSPSDVLAAVRLGHAVAFVASSFAPAGSALPGVVARPVDGLSTSHLRVAWNAAATSTAIAQFVQHAEEHIARPDDPVTAR
jgi:DNA-binding transcriptional LysR family regulator